jgi:hypothetical protein
VGRIGVERVDACAGCAVEEDPDPVGQRRITGEVRERAPRPDDGLRKESRI